MENSHQKPAVTPESIMQIGLGFWPSKILLTAIKLELFTHLAAKQKMSGAEIKSLFGFKCSDRHVFDFLDTLTTFGFLKREGLLEQAHYSNNDNTDFFLDKKKPSYLGGILEMANNRLYGFWGNLEQGLLTGLPQNEAKEGTNLFKILYSSPERLAEFMKAMSGIQMGNFIAFSKSFDFSKYKTLVDAGGASGMLSIMVAMNQPHMSCTTFDLPAVEPISQASINHFQISSRVNTASGDFFTDPLPKADVVTMGNILHDWDEENKIKLIHKAYEALPEGGVFVALENIIDEDRNKNAFGLMMSLNMLIETGKGFDYTFTDFTKWAKIAGFKNTAILPLTGPSSAAIAYK